VSKRGRLWLGLLGSVAFALSSACQPVGSITLDEYTKQLERLHTLAGDCARELTAKTKEPKACDPAAVGSDQIVSVAGGKRRVSYGWLQETLRQARRPQSEIDLKQVLTNLSEAAARLQQMAEQAASPRAGVYVPDEVANIRARLNDILDSGEYPQPKQPSLLERIWKEFVQWLLRALTRAMPRGSSTSAIYLLEFVVLAIPCGLLVWWFVRQLRVQKLNLPQESVPYASFPSSLAWQEWLAQGQRMGAEGRWREAIHHVYWGAISCLETRRFWPADRARTPREYLRLLKTDTEMHAEMLGLTRSFEHTWYGEAPAEEKDFRQACGVLERIAAG
jgi:hypothetical protein